MSDINEKEARIEYMYDYLFNNHVLDADSMFGKSVDRQLSALFLELVEWGGKGQIPVTVDRLMRDLTDSLIYDIDEQIRLDSWL